MALSQNPSSSQTVSRREFVKTASIGTAIATPLTAAASAWVAGSDALRIGLVGCGGRGTGAAFDALGAAESTQIVALADLFADRLEACAGNLTEWGERADVPADYRFTGWDAAERLISLDLDAVILATPPHFRPNQFKMAVDSGKHVFMEKPVAVDPAGIRTVIEGGKVADRKNLTVVAGTQRRHEASYLAAMRKLEEGSIGTITAARCYWNMGGLWMKEPRPEWTDMEWQVRNWLYFTWLSGDHIVEQHVHNVDVINWAMGGYPVRCMGMGGRQVRTAPEYGNIFDHFAIEYEYENGTFCMSMCRQTDGCAGRVAETIHGTDGIMHLRPGYAEISGNSPWKFNKQQISPYVQEHIDMVASIRGGARLNEADRIARSTLTAIMGRMSAYTGKEVTWDQAMSSTLDLSPPAYEFGPAPVRPVSVPGRTPLV